jgi:Protein of unknown function (DUF3047)
VRPRIVGLVVAALLSLSAKLSAQQPPPAWHATQTPQVIEDWSDTPAAGRLPAKWSFYGKQAEVKFAPAIRVDEGHRALWLKTERYSVRLARTIDVGFASTPVLHWEWKAVTLPMQGDLRGEIRDQVARIVLIFPPRYRPRMLGYVWDTRAPVGTEVRTKQTMLDRWLVVVRSGAGDVGQWVRESRNVAADYARLFGGAPPPPMAVGVESHSEDAAHVSEVYVGAITLGR